MKQNVVEMEEFVNEALVLYGCDVLEGPLNFTD